MIWLITVIAVLIAFAIWHYKKTYSVWSNQNVKGPLPLPLIGNLLRFIQGPMFEVDGKDFKKYGPIFGVYTGSTPVLMVNDVEIIKTVCIKDSHIFPNRQVFETSDPVMRKFLTILKTEEWKRGRKAVSPVFSTGKLKKMYTLMERCANEALDALKPYESGKDVDLKDFWGHYTLNVIAKCCFATDINSFKDENNDFILNAQSFFKRQFRSILVQFLLPKSIRELIGLKIGPGAALEFFSTVVDHLLKQRRESGKPNNNSKVDIVQLLLDTKNESKESEEVLIDDNFIKAQSIIFFVAGYETTATLLTFSSYVLATNLLVQDQLYETVVKLKQEDGRINYEDLMSSKYLDAFISEVLRMYPPALQVVRLADEEYVVPGHGIIIPKGGQVAFNPYCIHRNPEYYSEPDVFNPERFSPENSDLLVPNTQLAFGLGPRNCIAMRFALLEAKLVIARALLQYEFVKTKSTKVPLEFETTFGFLKGKSVVAGIERR